MKQQTRFSVIHRIYLFEFLAGMHFFSAVLTPFYTDWGGVSLAIGQLLQSWFTLWIFLLEVPTGIIADKFGCKVSIHYGCLIIAIATLVYGSYPSLAMFALGEFLFAVGAALISGADKAMFYDHLKQSGMESQAAALWGKARSAHMVGILVAAPIGSLIAHHMGINYAMILTSLPCLAAAWMIRRIPVDTLPEQSDTKQDFIKLARDGLNFLIHHRILRRWTLNSTIVATAAYFVIWLYQPMMSHLSISITWFGFAHAILVAAELIISASYSHLVKWAGSPSRYFKFTALATAVSLLLAAVYPSPVTLLLLLIIGGGFGLTRAEFMGAQMNQYIDSSNRATVNSAISMYRRITLAVLNPFVGMATETSPLLSLGLTGLIPLLALLFPV